jgi:hypothetical protein
MARGIANEEAGMRIVGIGGYSLTALALVALVGAFLRREKLRWLTVLPFVLLIALLGFGVSS